MILDDTINTITYRIDTMTSNEGIIISIFLGLFLALCIRLIYNENNNIIIKSPSRDTIENKIFTVENKCYSFVSQESKCSS